MPPTKLWFVRAGEGAAHVGEFLSDKHVAIGWNEVGPVTPTTTDEQLEMAFDRAYPDEKPRTRSVWLAMVRRFVRELKKGDGVITYDPDRRLYLLGEIDSEVEVREHELGRARRVRSADFSAGASLPTAACTSALVASPRRRSTRPSAPRSPSSS